MSVEELKQEALLLPPMERVSLAQALWQSISTGLGDVEEEPALREAIERDQELTSGAAAGRTHEQVMQAARSSLKCD